MGDPTIQQLALEERVNARQAENKASYDRSRVGDARRNAEAAERNAARTLWILGAIIALGLLLIFFSKFQGWFLRALVH